MTTEEVNKMTILTLGTCSVCKGASGSLGFGHVCGPCLREWFSALKAHEEGRLEEWLEKRRKQMAGPEGEQPPTFQTLP